MGRRDRALGSAIAITLLSGIAAAAWAERARPGPAPARASQGVKRRDGRLTFSVPADWQVFECPYSAPGCIMAVPPGVAALDVARGDQLGDVIFAIAASPNRVEGDPADVLLMPNSPIFDDDNFRRVTVDALPAVRMKGTSGKPFVLLVGYFPGDARDKFTVACSFRHHERIVRAACDRVIESLEVTRASPSASSSPS